MFTIAHPGQAVAAVHRADAAGAQGHAAVVQGDLRHGTEEKLPGAVEGGDLRQQQGRQAGARQVGHRAVGGGEAEHPVGGGHQAPGELHAFGGVGFQQALGTLAAQYRCQFPGQVDGVADPGVHALAAGRAVHVGGVPEEEHPAGAKLLGHPVMHLVGGEPVDLGHLDLELAHGALADILEAQVLRVLGTLVAHRADQPCAAALGRGNTARKSASSRSTCNWPSMLGPLACTSAT